MPAKVAVFGGSFDPPHSGHLAAMAFVLASADVDQVWMVPCWEHAFGKHPAAFEHRVQMCVEAVSGVFPDSRVRVMPIESVLQARYTFDLMHGLTVRSPKTEFSLVVGSDVYADLPKWHRIDDLRRMLGNQFIVVPRADYPVPEGTLGTPFYLPNISSTELRGLIEAGHLDELNALPRGVRAYIREHSLYQRRPEGAAGEPR